MKLTVENLFSAIFFFNIHLLAMERPNFPLHTAVEQHDYKKVKILLKNGADINAGNDIGLSPLYLALDKWNQIERPFDPHHPKLKTALTLIKAGANLNSNFSFFCNYYVELPCAIRNLIPNPYKKKISKNDFNFPTYQLVQELVTQGALLSPHDEKSDILHRIFTPLFSHYRDYILHNKLPNTKRLLTFYQKENAHIFVIAAAAKGDSDLIHYFSNKLFPLLFPSSYIAKAFHVAALRGNIACVDALLLEMKKYRPNYEKDISKTFTIIQRLLAHATLNQKQYKEYQEIHNYILNQLFKPEYPKITSYFHILPKELRELLFNGFCQINKKQ